MHKNICENGKTFVFNDTSVYYEKHFQNILEGIRSFYNNSYEGIIKEMQTNKFGKINAYYLLLGQYILNIDGKVVLEYAVNNLYSKLKNLISLIFGVNLLSISVVVLCFILLFVLRMKKEYKTIYTLKSVFEVTDTRFL